MVPSWTRLTSVDFDLQGSVPKETKSWPQRKWNSKSFVLSLEPLDIFGSFTDVSICFYSSLSISLEPLEDQKQKKSAHEECSKNSPRSSSALLLQIFGLYLAQHAFINLKQHEKHGCIKHSRTFQPYAKTAFDIQWNYSNNKRLQWKISYQELGTNQAAFLSPSSCCMSGTSFHFTYVTHWHDLTQIAADGAVYSCVSWLSIDRIDCMMCVICMHYIIGILISQQRDMSWRCMTIWRVSSVFEALATPLGQPCWLGMGCEKLRPGDFLIWDLSEADLQMNFVPRPLLLLLLLPLPDQDSQISPNTTRHMVQISMSIDWFVTNKSK